MKSKKIHFIGIGGIGMSGLARLYAHEGAEVSGSDLQETELTEKLKAEGMDIVYEQTAENIRGRLNLQLVVYTDALPEDHAELKAARDAGIKTQNYFEALSDIANEYYLIAVAGTHGKTTTTAMIIDIMEEAGLDPTAIVGSLRTKTGSNFRAGKSKYFVVEACEYKKHFLHLRPDVLVITNIEHEHTDYFENLEAVQDAFRELVMHMAPDSIVVSDQSDAVVEAVVRAHRGRNGYYYAYNELLKRPDFLRLQLTLPGIHNRKNAAAAATAIAALQSNFADGVKPEIVDSALEHFAGTWRRFQYKGDCNNAPVYDDYAHHPTEIAATIAAAREKYPDKNIVAVFQPHTYSRTKELRGDFVAALKKADHVILVPIYAAREKDDGSISSAMLAEEIGAEHFQTLEVTAERVKEIATKDHVVLVMGAGDVTKVASMLA